MTSYPSTCGSWWGMLCCHRCTRLLTHLNTFSHNVSCLLQLLMWNIELSSGVSKIVHVADSKNCYNSWSKNNIRNYHCFKCLSLSIVQINDTVTTSEPLTCVYIYMNLPHMLLKPFKTDITPMYEHIMAARLSLSWVSQSHWRQTNDSLSGKAFNVLPSILTYYFTLPSH